VHSPRIGSRSAVLILVTPDSPVGGATRPGSTAFLFLFRIPGQELDSGAGAGSGSPRRRLRHPCRAPAYPANAPATGTTLGPERRPTGLPTGLNNTHAHVVTVGFIDPPDSLPETSSWRNSWEDLLGRSFGLGIRWVADNHDITKEGTALVRWVVRLIGVALARAATFQS
jgi:hypothetical protein